MIRAPGTTCRRNGFSPSSKSHPLDWPRPRRSSASHGPNRLPEPPRRSALLRFLLQFHNILIYVLLGAAVITACSITGSTPA
jgi:magnesium-transporting ATPase (P-type)